MTEKKITKQFSHDELRAALLYSEELMERCQFRFVVAGEVGRRITESPDTQLSGDKIWLVMQKNDVTPSGLSIFKMFEPDAEIKKRKIAFKHKDVPIEIQIVFDKRYYFTHPDTVFWQVTEFKIPNPFEEYWKERYLIK